MLAWDEFVSRTIGNFARICLSRAKRLPAFRRLLKSPLIAPMLSSAAIWLPPADPAYERWIAARIQWRNSQYPATEQSGLLSLLTPVWNTPPKYLRELAETVLEQDGSQPFEWVVLDNGSTNEATLEVLRKVLKPDARVRLFRSEENLGIIGGMRFCLEQATGRYVAAVDHDDRLTPDCLTILAHHIQQLNYPPLLYSDEDHVCGNNRLLPYFKPDWDPVLFLNSAYIAHLGAMDRELALELDVYGDSATNSCPDWDAFLRFYQAGYEPLHIPEILYSWRMHPGSTSANMHSKSDVADSHRTMLSRYLQSLPNSNRYELRRSPLFAGTPDWWISRRPIDPRPLLLISVTTDRHSPHRQKADAIAEYSTLENITLPQNAHPGILSERLQDYSKRGGLVAFVDETLLIENKHWVWEALGLLERHPDIGLVGGRILDLRQRVVQAGEYFGVGEGTACPDYGRAEGDAGYFHQMWKQRSVDAVSSRLCVFEAAFLIQSLREYETEPLTLSGLGHWVSGFAARAGRRVVYSPFLSARETKWSRNWGTNLEQEQFLAKHRDLLNDSRYYSASLNSELNHAYQPKPLPTTVVSGVQ